ncbi:MAG: hypothetical protein AAGH78_09100 [Cyanobacteria bacterium P01_H01_bin.58]
MNAVPSVLGSSHDGNSGFLWVKAPTQSPHRMATRLQAVNLVAADGFTTLTLVYQPFNMRGNGQVYCI